MKTIMQGVATTLFCFAPIFLSAQACPTVDVVNHTGQQIIVNQTGQPEVRGNKTGLLVGTVASNTPVSRSNGTFNFSLADPDITVPNNDCRNSNCKVCGWYKAFWIFGDGNYEKFANDVSHMDNASHRVSYTYAKSALYTPAVYLTERYHNDKKPDAARIAINFTGGSPTNQATDRPRKLPDPLNKRADIDYNHELRKDYPTVFALSHLKSDSISRTLFYYNSTWNKGEYTPQEIITPDKPEIPAYYKPGRGFETNFGDISSSEFNNRFGNSILSQLSGMFLSCYEFNYQAGTIDYATADGLNEMRVFPVMNTKKFEDGKIPLDSAIFMSLVLGPKPLTGEALNKVRNEVASLIGQNNDITISEQLLVSINEPDGEFSSSEYIKGISFAKIKVLASHDPNNLFVTKIDNLANDRYRVFFSMRICNEGEGIETAPSLAFYDLSGGNYASRPQLVDLPASVTPYWGRQGGRIDTVKLDRFIIRGVPYPYEPRCEFVQFYIDTDLAGVNKLYQETPRALKVCVTFSGGTSGSECSDNDVLKQGELDDEPIPPPSPNDCWLLFFLALLVLILIIYAWRNFQQNT